MLREEIVNIVQRFRMALYGSALIILIGVVVWKHWH